MTNTGEFDPGPRHNDFVITRSRPELADLTDAFQELSAATSDFVRSKAARDTLQWDQAQYGRDARPMPTLLAAVCRLHFDRDRLSTAVSRMVLRLGRYAGRRKLDRAGWQPWEVVAEKINVDCAMSLLQHVVNSCYPLEVKFPRRCEEADRVFAWRREQIIAPEGLGSEQSAQAAPAPLNASRVGPDVWVFQKADADAESELGGHVVTIRFASEALPWEW